MDEQPVDGTPGQPEAGEQRGDQEVARDDGGVVGGDAGAGGVAEGQREQEEGDGRRRDNDGTADVRHQPAQGDDLGAERGEALDEYDGVDQQARHGRLRALSFKSGAWGMFGDNIRG